jgi:aspartokinase
MVNSISKTVQTLIDNDISLQEALQKDYGNYSAIARLLLPKVRELLGHDAKLESVITAVKRTNVGYKLLRGNTTKVVAKSVINIRTDVAKISVEKTKRNLEKIRQTLASYSEEFFHIIEGISAITLVFDQELFNDIVAMFREKEVLDKRENLAAIIICSPIEMVSTPECVLTFYNAVSRRHINIEETMSCFTDTIIVLSMEDVSKALAALTDLISEARKQLVAPKTTMKQS